MNLKAVEMQIAVPRTGEAGRVQQDAQQRPAIEQNMLSAEQLKHQEHQRQRSTGVDESAQNTTVKREGQQSGQHQGQAHAEEQEEEQSKDRPAAHPFKGKHIDFSL
ncbi:hypothetical protein [Paenibacillus brevis]|uniref:RNA polymerase subunit sigma n=1 Tax=Paenibacillus brevis TaxID=2841508 RepID=A0ABS6FU95_9BACL|nr:hypothetical protein [Paenibacillus brevis]MBU5673052.1 hypothetical protein [Paenibacillus brevis]